MQASLDRNYTVFRSTSFTTSAPEPPTNLRVTANSNNGYQLSVAFTRSANADYYQFYLQRAETSGGGYSVISSTRHNSHTTPETFLTLGGYWYRVVGQGCLDLNPQDICSTGVTSDNTSNVVNPPFPVHFFSPEPLELGDASDTWTVPTGVSDIYLSVVFSSGQLKESNAGNININRIDSNGNIVGIYEVDNQNDSTELAQVTTWAGERVLIDVDNDAFDYAAALVDLTFHAGIDVNGPRIAVAKVQKQKRPSAPRAGTYIVQGNNLTLRWNQGPAKSGASPDHYEVVVPNPANSATPLYSDSNVDDSSNQISHTITDFGSLDLEGTLTAQVRHCNAVGGCSEALNITLNLPINCPDPSVPANIVANDRLHLTAVFIVSRTQDCNYRLTLVSWDAATYQQVIDRHQPTVSGSYDFLPTKGGNYRVGLEVCADIALTNCSTPVYSTTSVTKIRKPEGFNVIPHENDQRKAILRWVGSPLADGYKVEGQPGGGTWTTIRVSRPTVPQEPINLDSYLVENISYEFRVQAADSTGAVLTSELSDSITIIDNPINYANGASTAGNGQAHLKWAAIQGASGGEYAIRYLKLPSPATWVKETNWRPYRGGSRDTEFDTARPLEERITGLTDGQAIYAMQLVYGPTSTDALGKKTIQPTIFSARDVYVWPSDGLPERGWRIGTFPFFGHWPDKEYRYSICDGTFPSAHRTGWKELISHAFEQWESSTGLVKMSPLNPVVGCQVNDNIPLSIILSIYNERNEVLMVDHSDVILSLIIPGQSLLEANPLVLCLIQAYACVISPAYWGNEGAQDELATQDELANNSVDVLIYQNRVQGENRTQDVPGSDRRPGGEDVRLNTCMDPTNAGKDFRNYAVMVHEAGHTLGLSGFSSSSILVENGLDNDAHPLIPGTVMNLGDKETSRIQNCSPRPFDIMAIYALYGNIP